METLFDVDNLTGELNAKTVGTLVHIANLLNLSVTQLNVDLQSIVSRTNKANHANRSTFSLLFVGFGSQL